MNEIAGKKAFTGADSKMFSEKMFWLVAFALLLLGFQNAVAVNYPDYNYMYDVFGIYADTNVLVGDINSIGDVNIGFQVRSCNDSACAGESFVGPNNSATTWFTTDFQSSILWDLNAIAGNRWFQYTFHLTSNFDANQSPSVFNTSVSFLSPNVVVERGLRFGYPNTPLFTLTSYEAAFSKYVTIGTDLDINAGLSNGDLNVSHNVFVDNNVYAENYVDMTPAWLGSSKDALTAITSISNVGKEIDHDTLPEFAKSVVPFYERRQIGENCGGVFSPIITHFCEPVYDYFLVPEKGKPARNLGAMVTILTESIKALKEENDLLKKELCGKDFSYTWCNGLVS